MNEGNAAIRLYEDGVECHPVGTIIFGNLMMALWIALGTIACWFVHPYAAWAYLATALVTVGLALRKLVCTNCYYYGKRCATGWGKLSALLFRKGPIENFSTSVGIKVAPLTYGLLSLVPLVLVIAAMLWGFTWAKLAVLLALLGVSFYSGAIARRKACAGCKMSTICPGSAVKRG